jgi:pimeloyl-ACP methyl ester carboxylesterase
MPLIVLSAGQSSDRGQCGRAERLACARARQLPEGFWEELQRELAAQLPGARHTIAERSGHLIQERQPQYVWASVRDIVIALRGQ